MAMFLLLLILNIIAICCICFFLMIRRPPRSTRTDTLFPYTTLFRSRRRLLQWTMSAAAIPAVVQTTWAQGYPTRPVRSEEHTSELQSLMRISYAVFCLKKKNKPVHITSVAHLKHQRHTKHKQSTSHSQ